MLLAPSEAQNSAFLKILSGAPIAHASLPRNRLTKASSPIANYLWKCSCATVVADICFRFSIPKISIFLLSIITCWTFDSSR
jgi:hypothetical protein